MNIIPESISKTPNYWCTWWMQNVLAETGSQTNAFGNTGHSLIASMLTEENVIKGIFDKEILKKVRKDVYVMYDLGWDVPSGTNFQGAWWNLGSIEAAEDKFPSCTGSPEERLRKLNELTQKYGWRGAALWIPAHACGEGVGGKYYSKEEQIEFFRERLRWCHKAGIEYWKVDYGFHGASLEFRKMLTELAREEAPNLIVEHANNIGPLNDQVCPWESREVGSTGRYKYWDDGKILNNSIKMVGFSDNFRVYDNTFTLATPTLLDRVAELLKAYSGQGNCTCILNCETEAYTGAALGCAIGVMEFEERAMDQYVRAIRWQRLAPAEGVGASETYVDSNNLEDNWDFRKGSDWFSYEEPRDTKQCAPARVSRNMEPAIVEKGEEEVPYVINSRNTNGAVSVATLPRVSVARGKYFPKAKVTIEVGDGKAPVGIFGYYEVLVLKLSRPLGKKRVWAQDLAADEAEDITDRVQIQESAIILSGALIEEIGLSRASKGDISPPAMVLVIREKA
jgi:hypothetical protein